MSITIYKYPLVITDRYAYDMPRGARVLAVAEQEGNVCAWALVDTDNADVQRHLAIVGTGRKAETVGEYVGTVAMRNGLVWHVFDEGET